MCYRLCWCLRHWGSSHTCQASLFPVRPQLCMAAGNVKLAQPLQEISEQHLVKLKKESECILVSEILFLDINI